MKKVVLKVDVDDGKAKQKALKKVSTLSGIDSIAMDLKEKKLTLIGTVDPVNVVSKLRKYWPTDIILVGPAKEPEKPKEEPKKEEEAKKEEPKKEEPPKEEAKKEEPKKEEEKKKETAAPPPPEPVLDLVKAYRTYNPYLTTYNHGQSIEENPNDCVIC